MTTIASYGSWLSPISPDLLTSGSPSFGYISSNCLHDSDGNVYWLESRPWENGRSVVVEKNVAGEVRDLLPEPLSARSKVHEYGGTPYIVVGDTLYFCLYDDQRIYAINIHQQQPIPEPVTEDNGYRYADFCYDAKNNRLICVCENHSQPDRNNKSKAEPENFIAAIALDGSGGICKLASGNDFYAYPRLSPDNQQLCWISWNHPNMPWHGTTLTLAALNADGSLNDKQQVITGGFEEAIFQPQWSPSGVLHYVSDRNNWWNIYRYNSVASSSEIVTEKDSEFATPLWVLGMSTYGFCSDGTLICCYTQNGEWQLARIDTDGQLTNIDTDYSAISAIHCDGQQAWFIGASSSTEPEVAAFNLATRQTSTESVVRPQALNKHYLSQPQAISFDTADKLRAYGFYYPPKNADYTAPNGEKPPLLVMCHGGPTGATSTALNLKIQFWTSRGFAVLDVNYRGSTGYGRGFRQQLNNQWGIADVEDVIYGAEHLVKAGLVDGSKLAIRGSSAGGYTVLAALTFHNTFKVGACLYGIGDLEALATDTHKFESRYLDHLIGPYPEQLDRYQQRSPIHHTEQLDCPVIFFQGLDDKVVPPEQAVTMINALRKKKLPVAYLPFSGEGHGFRKVETICRALQAELYFYSRIFGFDLPTAVDPVGIENLRQQS